MHVKEKVSSLKNLLDKNNIDAYIIPTDDFHSSEYVGEFFKSRAFITGFTGSAGTAVITGKKVQKFQEGVGLWTDGRYFLQAENQLAGSGIKLFKMAEPNVPTLTAFLGDILPANAVIGFDGRTVSASLVNQIKEEAASKGKIFTFVSNDLVEEVWVDRPKLSCTAAEDYPVCYAGKSREEKISDLREEIEKKSGEMFVLTALDDIAWLLNIRGRDVECNPVVLSYFVIDGNKAVLFVQEQAIKGIREDLEAAGITIKPYNDVYEYLDQNTSGKKVILDQRHINYDILRSISEKAELVNLDNYKLIPKAVKNEIEQANMEKAHIKDAVAKVKWIYWLKSNVGKIHMDEMSVAEKLSQLRSQQENSRGDSFPAIMGYREHGAIIHYSVTPESKSVIKAEGMLLADTGGQYLEGTTDVTRTIVLGHISEEEKKCYTAVLQGHLELGDAYFPYGTKGSELDHLARTPLAEIGYSYNHGTGHGVGMYLNVHEDPVRITHASVLGQRDIVFEDGMITSNEPGVYIEGAFGIRIENLMLCKKAEIEDDKQMMKFRPLTYIPYDKAAVLKEQMTERQKKLFNDYQQEVYNKISPYLTEDERQWLRQETMPI